MPLALFSSARFADHVTPPGHPERPERGEVLEAVADRFRERGGTVLEPRAASREELARIHRAEYLDQLTAIAGRAAMLDSDTYTSPDSVEVAALAAGAVLASVDFVLGDDGRKALALVRPPGHHAEADRAMGFCLYNNVAVAAAHARAKGIARVAIVDFDVHHGNGTQHSFWQDETVLFISSHQYPFYPGTGAAGEIGEGAGAGFTVNLPLEAGATDGDVMLVYERCVRPLVRAFQPGLLLVSAGFDAHERDPLGQLRMTTAGFHALAGLLGELADTHCRGRLVAVTEGGYDLQALNASIEAVARRWAGEPPQDEASHALRPATTRGDTCLAAVRAARAGRGADI